MLPRVIITAAAARVVIGITRATRRNLAAGSGIAAGTGLPRGNATRGSGSAAVRARAAARRIRPVPVLAARRGDRRRRRNLCLSRWKTGRISSRTRRRHWPCWTRTGLFRKRLSRRGSRRRPVQVLPGVL
uniref:(northern house mosquito) hypothetical protein n=1 Tax=Culex pipiens TaxID=7175 RepID=A0A8D8IT48_CULPI